MKKFLPYLLISFVIALANWPTLSAKQVADPDAEFILSLLSNTHSPLHYLQNLLQFKTLDFQPLRDISLGLDLFLFNQYDLNTFILQNLLWWLGCVLVIQKILRKFFPDFSAKSILLATLIFAIYPIFIPTLAWGMARKHILCFFFTLLATHELLTKRNVFYISLFYLLATLSQPIGILWPVWALSYLYFYEPQDVQNSKKIFLSLGMILVTMITINTFYYRISETFLVLYPSKTSTSFILGDKLLAFGHYTFQIFFPYFQSLNYSLGRPFTLMGLILLVIFVAISYKYSQSKKILLWLLFALLPLIVITTLPQMMSDTYLLLPALGVFIVVLDLTRRFPKRAVVLIPVMIVFWTIFSFNQSKLWTNKSALLSSSFENDPNCVNALNAARMNFAQYQKASSPIMEFIKANECLGNINQTVLNSHINQNFLMNAFYFEDQLTPEIRLAALQEMANTSLTAHLYIVALLIHENKLQEAQEVLKTINAKVKGQDLGESYLIVVDKVIVPYCEKINDPDCRELAGHFSKKARTPYL